MATDRRGALAVVGLAPGAASQLTPAARDALVAAEVVVGYATYLDLVALLILGKEIDRGRAAVRRAREGARVALVSSGDAGVFGMASLALEVLRDEGWRRGDPP